MKQSTIKMKFYSTLLSLVLLPLALALPQPATNSAHAHNKGDGIKTITQPQYTSDDGTGQMTIAGFDYGKGPVRMRFCSVNRCEVGGRGSLWYASDPGNGDCVNLNHFQNDKIVAYHVWDGCCAFYK
ncbi:hypothetical protein FPQ18DRAFT_425485 [Pyronema domesticum]|nr:hypothetical protein FPQ18DRAFT_425485 [Pyronema domesticum]